MGRSLRRCPIALRLSLATVVVASSPTLAADPNPRSWAGAFAGATLGMSKTYDYSAGDGTVLSTDDNTDFSYVAFGGYQFLKYFGLAGAYVDLGTASYAGNVPLEGDFTDKLSSKGINIMPMGFLPVAPQHAVFGYVGLFRWSQDVDFNASITGPFKTTDRGTSPSMGLGYNWYAIDQNLGIHIEYSRFFDVGDNDNSGHEYDRDFFSAGVVWSFR